ncbi:hypothetical protein [Bdellovibrio sp.]|uniref:hypothetical protein n=1 Tax=Bdellovibrio TaxID=958 RepID=UPI003221978A
MKRVLIVASVLAFHFSVLADEANVKVPVPEGFGTMEMEGMPSEVSQKSKVKFSSSCTDITGRTIKQGDAGYETCLSDVKLKSVNQKQSDNKNSTNPGPQMNMNFSVGD